MAEVSDARRYRIRGGMHPKFSWCKLAAWHQYLGSVLVFVRLNIV